MINVVYVDDSNQVARILQGLSHAAALDIGIGARKHCVVFCQNTQVTHDIARHYQPHLTIYNVGDDHTLAFDDGVRIDDLLMLFCNANGIDPDDQRAATKARLAAHVPVPAR